MRLHESVVLRWGDVDAYGHVNNVEVLRLLEEARIRAFWSAAGASSEQPSTAVIDGGPSSQTLMYISRHEVEYRRPLVYQRDPVEIQLWIADIGGASLDIAYEIRAVGDHESACIVAETTVAFVDAQTRRPRRISSDERAAWRPYLEARPRMGRRSRS